MKIRKVSLVVPIVLMMSMVLLIPQVSYAESLGGFVEDDFTRISEGGFDDPMNNYAWSMAYFDGDLYVGTGRNILYTVGLALKEAGIIDPELELPDVTHPGGNPGDPEWAGDMSAEIWRYQCGEWELVHKAKPFTIETNPEGTKTYPEGIGYRIMTTFKDAIYAGIGGGFGNVLLIWSPSGDFDTWQPVDRTGIPFYYTDTRSMVAHHGKLYVGTSGGLFQFQVPGEIYANPNPGDDPWTQVTNFGDWAPENTAVLSLASFNGYLYATTQNAVNGFEVWRSTVIDPTSDPSNWERIVIGGAGDAWNVWGGTTETFNDHLYVGSMSLPIPPLGPKGFDLIRIDTEDHWELIVGSYEPSAPTVPRGPPLSGWPSGFANPLNFYCWSLEEHCGYLYLGSFDASAFLRYITPEIIESLIDEGTLDSIAEELLDSGIDETYVQELLEILDEEDLTKLIQLLWQYLGGADLWKSCDGIHWIPVSLNGFDNPFNYGFRTMVSTPDGLYVGTSNPWEGCEVWLGTKGTVVSTDEGGDAKFQFLPNEDVYVKGEGFPRCKDVTIYVIPDGLDPEPGNAVAESPGKTDICGKLPVTLVWSAPLDFGEYDVWVDVNQNGEHDNCDVYVAKALKCYMFFVIPESPLGAIVSVLTMIGALGVFALKKKRILAFK